MSQLSVIDDQGGWTQKSIYASNTCNIVMWTTCVYPSFDNWWYICLAFQIWCKKCLCKTSPLNVSSAYLLAAKHYRIWIWQKWATILMTGVFLGVNLFNELVTKSISSIEYVDGTIYSLYFILLRPEKEICKNTGP